MIKTRSTSTDQMANKMNDCVQINLRITTNSNQGGRKYMEDAYTIALQRLNASDKESPISLAYFGIFDGHGGKEAAEFARQSLCQHILEQDEFWTNTSDENQNDQAILSAIRKGFLACHSDMWNHVAKWSKTSSGLPSTSGSTASVIFIRGNKLYIGHVGDSAIVLAEGDTLYKPWSANRLTRDHKPEDPLELKRIRESGGNVLCKAGVHRVVWNRQKISSTSSYRHRHQHSITTTTTTNGTTIEYEQIPFLAVSRALGDLWSLNTETNLYSVSPEPELMVIQIDPNKHRSLILASDGLWNMITPEVAVEIVRNCDIKTEDMILKSEDDDHRPFRNPSHELVQKALTLWHERMLRSDNITCITVMLDPPGPPFSDCIVKKKKEKLISSVSSSTASICSNDTIDLDHLSPTTPTMVIPQRTKPVLERKEHILIPISNGPTPMRTPKRPVSEDPSTSLTDTSPRRKLIKIDPHKENGRTSLSTNSTESEMRSTSPSQSQTTNTEEIDHELLSSTEEEEEAAVSSMSVDNEDLMLKVERFFRNNTEEQLEDHPMQIDPSSQESSSNGKSVLHRSQFSSSTTNQNDSSVEEKELINSSDLHQMRSISSTIPINSSSSRRESSNSPHSIDNSNPVESDQTERDSTTNLQQNFTSSKMKSSLTNLSSPNSRQSLVKPPLSRAHKPSSSIDDVFDSTPPSSK